MNEQELNKKLSEWLFPPPKYRLAEVSPGYVYPDREYVVERQATEQVWYYHESLPPFTECLDGCFQWLVPASDVFAVTALEFWPSAKGWVCGLSANGGWHFVNAQASHPALAFCLALDKLIKEYREE